MTAINAERQGGVRRDRASRRCRRRQPSALSDRRRGRSRHQERVVVDRLADRTSVDRQAGRRRGRSLGSERQARPTRSLPSSTSERARSGRAVGDADAARRSSEQQSLAAARRSATSTSSRPSRDGWRSRAVFKLQQIRRRSAAPSRDDLRRPRRGAGRLEPARGASSSARRVECSRSDLLPMDPIPGVELLARATSRDARDAAASASGSAARTRSTL